MGTLAMLLAIPYWFVVNWCVTTIEGGGPHWLNAVVLLAAWNIMKFVIVGPVSMALLIATRMREGSTRRRADAGHRVQATTCTRTGAGGELN